MAMRIDDIELVAKATEALISYCHEHGVLEVPTYVVVEFAIAVREGGPFVWTAHGEEFTRINFASAAHNRLAMVYNFGDIIDQLVYVLNQALYTETEGLAGMCIRELVAH
jgi:hypothetical protein